MKYFQEQQYASSRSLGEALFLLVATIGAVVLTVLALAVPARGEVVFEQDFENGLGPNETTSGPRYCSPAARSR